MKKRKVKLFASIASLGLVVAVMGVGVWAATQQAVKVSSQVSFTATSVAADIKLSINNAATPKEGDADFANAAKYAQMKEYDIVKEATLSYAMKGVSEPESNQYAKSEEAKDQLYSEKAIIATPDTVDPSINTYEYDEAHTNPYGEGRAQARRIAYFTNDYAKTLFNNRIYLNLQDKDEDGYLNVGAKVVYEFRIEALTSSAPIFYDIEANLFEKAIYTPDPVYDSGTGKYVAQDPVRIKDAFEVNIIDVGTVNKTTPTQIDSEGIAATTPVSASDRKDTNVPTTTLTNWAGDVADATNKTPTGEAAEKAIKPGETRVIQIVYTVKDMDGAGSDLYQGISYTMTSLQLGDIYIRLANNGANINTLPNYDNDNNAETFDKVVEWTTPKEDKPEITPVGGEEG